MKQSILFLLLISCSISCLAQTQVSFSPEYKLSKSKNYHGHLHSDSTGHYVYFKEYSNKIGSAGYYFTLEKYDKELNLVFSEQKKPIRKELQSFKLRYLKNEFGWIQYERDKKKKSIQYYYTPISLDGTTSGSLKSIARFQYGKDNEEPEVKLLLSKDTSSVLLIGEYDRDNKNKKFRASVSVFNDSFEKQWRKTIRLPYSQKRVTPLLWSISNEGTIYLVARIEDEKIDKTKNRSYKIHVYYMTGEMDAPQEYEVDLGVVHNKMIWFDFEEPENINLFGLWGESKKGSIKGLYYTKLGKEGEVLQTDKRAFTSEEIKTFERMEILDDRKKADGGLEPKYYFKKAIFLENGKIHIAAEKCSFYKTTYTGSDGRQNDRTIYVRSSILSIQIDGEGNLQDMKVIPKKQEGSFTTDLSYAFFEHENKSVFLYNDDKYNIENDIMNFDDLRMLGNRKTAVAVLATIDKDGELKRKVLFGNEDTETFLLPWSIGQISDNELFFYTTKSNMMGKKVFRLGTISLQ